MIGAARDAGLLDGADTAVADAVGRAVPETTDDVLLAVALAVRAVRDGHVCLVPADADALLADLAPDVARPVWPDPAAWAAALSASSVVASPDQADDDPRRPLVFDGRRVWLLRMFLDERAVAASLLARADAADPWAEPAQVSAVLDRLFPDAAPGDAQRDAVAAGLTRRLVVLAGGPGTGKTWTVARLLAGVHALRPDALVALAAPTGKAAARMGEAVRAAGQVGDPPTATTVHKLLGMRPGGPPRHHARNPLPHDVVVVDETSMVALPLMAALLDAVRPDATLVLVGDPHQLASVEAGAVLGDVVGPPDAPAGPLTPCVRTLSRVHRFGDASPVARLADAVRTGDLDAALAVLAEGDDVRWVRPDDVGPLLTEVTDAAADVARAGLAGDAAAGLDAAKRCKVLTAGRWDANGLVAWSRRIEAAVSRRVPDLHTGRRWYAGRPLLGTRNDPLTRVNNGDTGLVVEIDGALWAVFDGPDGPRPVAPAQLSAVDTWWAMTIHKSQGSEFDHAVVALPDAPSRLLTRELLYTGVTRARTRVTVVATPDALARAVTTPVRRASGLSERLWASPPAAAR